MEEHVPEFTTVQVKNQVAEFKPGQENEFEVVELKKRIYVSEFVSFFASVVGLGSKLITCV